jgi:hypothetical protein
MRLRTVLAASNLDTSAAVSSSELLRGGNEHATNTTPLKSRRNDETRDAAEEPVGVKERNAVK